MVTSLQGSLLHAVRSLTTTGSQSTQPLDKEAIDRQQPSDPTAAPNGSADARSVGRAKTEEDTSSWKATPLQKAVAAGGMVATAAIGGALIAGGAFSTVGSGAVVVASMIGAYLVTDMGTAMVHVVIDNLDCETIPESLPWLRRLVEDFQHHHENPRDIVKREFANHTADAQVITTPMLIGLAVAAITRPHLAPLIAAATVSANAAVLSQEFHKRSHMRPDESAPIWQLLKDIGLAVSTKRHAKHHTQGHTSHYALLNGFTNVFLDGVKFKLTPGGPKTNLIRKIEVAIYGLTAAEPQSWRENRGLREIALGLEPGREERSARANTAGIPDIATLVDAPRLLATRVLIEPCTYKAVGELQRSNSGASPRWGNEKEGKEDRRREPERATQPVRVLSSAMASTLNRAAEGLRLISRLAGAVSKRRAIWLVASCQRLRLSGTA